MLHLAVIHFDFAAIVGAVGHFMQAMCHGASSGVSFSLSGVEDRSSTDNRQ
jgi:hypothetical protein